MKITTWNLDYWKRTPEQRTKAWSYLFDFINPDISLLQEIRPPETQLDNRSFLYHEIDGKRKWGTALVSKLPIQKEIYSNKSYPGASGLITAEIKHNNSLTLTVINIYGLLDSNGYATTTMHHLLSDLTPILDHKGTRNIILGGDFNVSRQFDDKYNWPAHRIVFERIEDFGLINCTQKFFSKHIQTHVHNRSKFEWQDDYLFVSKNMESLITDCKVIGGESMLEYSDHYPVLIELKI
jgi:exonuclease III